MKTFIIYKTGEVTSIPDIQELISRYQEPHSFADILLVQEIRITNGGIDTKWFDQYELQELLDERLQSIKDEDDHEDSHRRPA